MRPSRVVEISPEMRLNPYRDTKFLSFVEGIQSSKQTNKNNGLPFLHFTRFHFRTKTHKSFRPFTNYWSDIVRFRNCIWRNSEDLFDRLRDMILTILWKKAKIRDKKVASRSQIMTNSKVLLLRHSLWMASLDKTASVEYYIALYTKKTAISAILKEFSSFIL